MFLCLACCSSAESRLNMSALCSAYEFVVAVDLLWAAAVALLWAVVVDLLAAVAVVYGSIVAVEIKAFVSNSHGLVLSW